MKIPFVAFIIQGIPESIAIITLAFLIARIPLQWKRIVLIGFTVALTSYVIRFFPVTFGIHTIMIMGLQFFLLVQVGKGNINSCLIASLISTLTIILVETISLSILMPLFGVTSEVFFADTKTRILITLPQVFIMFILSFILLKYRFRRDNHRN